ncbi:hypothetical protein ES707_22527 [subsurface metagenome]
MKTEFFRSATAVFLSRTASSFATDVDSPVKIASSVFRATTSRSRASAGMRSPASKRTRSPGTTFRDGMNCSVPSLSTRALGAVIFFMASIAFSDRYSCTKPTMALRNTMAPMVAASMNSSISPLVLVKASTMERVMAIRSMITNMSLNCPKNI